MDLIKAPRRLTLNSVLAWLYLPPGYLTFIRIILGIISIPDGMIVFNWAHGGPGPYNVYAWRIGTRFFEFPLPPEWFNIVVYVAYGLSCLVLIAGRKSRIATGFLLACLFLYGSRDLMAHSPHYIMLNMCFLAALLFDNGKISCSRRIIQLAIFGCYFLSAINKLVYPGWMEGFSLQSMFEDASALSPMGKILLGNFRPGILFYEVNSWIIVLGEFFLAFAFFFSKLRKPAAIIGVLLHGFITVFMEPMLIIFSAIMMTGWLAFFPKPAEEKEAKEEAKEEVKEEAKEGQQDKPSFVRTQSFLALIVILVIFVVPLRTWLFMGTHPNAMTPFDRMPWSYHMFVIGHYTSKFKDAYWTDDKGEKHAVNIEGRMARASSDSELIALSDYLFRKYDSARTVHLALIDSLNSGRWLQTKILDATAPSNTSAPHIETSNQYR